MLKTRDFVLYLLIVAFILITSSATLLRFFTPAQTETESTVSFVSPDEVTFSGELGTDGDVSRSERLAQLRQQIEASGGVFISEGDTEQAPDDSEEVPVGVVAQCPGYSVFSQRWDESQHSFAVLEGARVLTRTERVVSGTTTDISSETVAVLPLSPVVTATPNCLASDVVGFTPNGGLIRNSEGARYAAVPEGSLVGYALDGFPIFGPTTADRDQCGGAITAGLYRYHVGLLGEGLLNCFTAVPNTL